MGGTRRCRETSALPIAGAVALVIMLADTTGSTLKCVPESNRMFLLHMAGERGGSLTSRRHYDHT